MHSLLFLLGLQLVVNGKQFVLQLPFLLLVAVLHAVAFVVLVDLHLASGHKRVFIRPENLIYELELRTYFFLPVADRKLPLLSGSLVLYIDKVDCVDAATQEQEPRNVHEH